MTGKQLRGIDPRIAGIQPPRASASPGQYKNFHQWQTGLTLIVPIGFRNALASTRRPNTSSSASGPSSSRSSTRRPTRWPGSSSRSTPTTSSSRRPSGSAQAAQIRLESARAYYEEGRTGFTIDRLLDAVSQYANAIAQEAQFKASYNTSIAALEEAKGTCWPTTTSPWPRARARGRRTSRPATSRPATASSRSRTTAP